MLNWFLRTNSKQLLMWFAGAATCVFLMQMVVTCTGVVVKSAGGNTYTMGFTPENYKHALFVVKSIVLVVMSIATLFVLSGVFRQLNKKQKAISFLMLPAANKEKYWVLLVYVTVAWTLCLFFDVQRPAVCVKPDKSAPLFHPFQWEHRTKDRSIYLFLDNHRMGTFLLYRSRIGVPQERVRHCQCRITAHWGSL